MSYNVLFNKKKDRRYGYKQKKDGSHRIVMKPVLSFYSAYRSERCIRTHFFHGAKVLICFETDKHFCRFLLSLVLYSAYLEYGGLHINMYYPKIPVLCSIKERIAGHFPYNFRVASFSSFSISYKRFGDIVFSI